MADVVNLFEHLLARGKRLQALGRHRDAGAVYVRLTGLRQLPGPVAEEAQLRLAELALRRRRFAQARRHLGAALRHQSAGARGHFLMATALQGEDGDLDRAAEHYRRALELAPDNVRYRGDAGLLELRRGRTEEGLALLRDAAGRAPDSPEAIARLVKGLLQAGRPDEARSALRCALFRNSRSPRFRKLWADFQFQELRRLRETERLREAEGSGPVLLPFPRLPEPAPVSADEAEDVRRDVAAPLPAPHAPRLLRRRVQ
jgi:Tfp pilus assembly protein PilF